MLFDQISFVSSVELVCIRLSCGMRGIVELQREHGKFAVANLRADLKKRFFGLGDFVLREDERDGHTSHPRAS